MSKKYTEEDLKEGWQRYLLFKAILQEVKPVFKVPNSFFRVYSDSFKAKSGRYRRKSVNIVGFTDEGHAFMRQFADKTSYGRYNFSVPLVNPVTTLALIKTVKIPEDIEERIKIFRVERRLDKKEK